MPLGPLATKNNLTGITQVSVALSGTTAKTWTHSFNATPLAVMLFSGGVPIVQGSGAGQVAVSANTTTITLTPATYTGTVDVLIWWCLPSTVANGVPATNFA